MISTGMMLLRVVVVVAAIAVVIILITLIRILVISRVMIFRLIGIRIHIRIVFFLHGIITIF